MTKSIQEILSPLLTISYVCGLRVKFPVGDQKQWYNFLYLLLLWALYYFIVIHSISYTAYYSTEYHIFVGIHIFTTIISFIIGIYYDKIFRNCIKKLVIVDDTLKKLGKTTNYHKFKMKIACLILGWSVIIILLTYLESYNMKGNNANILPTIIIPFIRNYCIYILCIGDLIIVIILGYTGMKFDQINEYLKKLSEDNKYIKLAWEYSMLRSCKSKFSKISKNKCVTKCNKIWIIMHLHSELRRISRETDCIFGIQMTLEMGCYFACIAPILRQIFCFTYDKNYIIINNEMLYITILIIWLFIYVFRLLLINYVCERVTTKANATGNFINKLSYLTYDTEIYENILQFSLQIVQSPLRFYGLGLFQFGFKFLYGFFASISTLLVIYIQAFTNNKYLENNNYMMYKQHLNI